MPPRDFWRRRCAWTRLSGVPGRCSPTPSSLAQPASPVQSGGPPRGQICASTLLLRANRPFRRLAPRGRPLSCFPPCRHTPPVSTPGNPRPRARPAGPRPGPPHARRPRRGAPHHVRGRLPHGGHHRRGCERSAPALPPPPAPSASSQAAPLSRPPPRHAAADYLEHVSESLMLSAIRVSGRGAPPPLPRRARSAPRLSTCSPRPPAA